MTETISKLKPCPFCGNVPKIDSKPESHGYKYGTVFIACCNGIMIEEDVHKYDWKNKKSVFVEEKSLKEIANKWNKRAGGKDD